MSSPTVRHELIGLYLMRVMKLKNIIGLTRPEVRAALVACLEITKLIDDGCEDTERLAALQQAILERELLGGTVQ